MNILLHLNHFLRIFKNDRNLGNFVKKKEPLENTLNSLKNKQNTNDT